jgi:hypothetical protein
VREETVEVYGISLDLDDASREELNSNRREVIKRFLESQGYTVNALTVQAPHADEDMRSATLHHIPGGEDKSYWVETLK